MKWLIIGTVAVISIAWLGRILRRAYKDAPSEWKLMNLLKSVNEGPSCEIGGKWYPARPMGYYSLQSRLRLAWLVFRGRADALTWPEDAP